MKSFSRLRKSLSEELVGLIAIVGLLIAFGSIIGCSLIGRQVIENPKIEFHNVDVRDMTASGATVVFGVQIENPNPFELKVDSVRYDVDIGGKKLSSGRLAEGAKVAANSKTIVAIPVPVRYVDVFSSLLDFMGKGVSTFRVRGDATMGLISVPFDHAGELKFKK